jgi:hypothetical protein
VYYWDEFGLRMSDVLADVVSQLYAYLLEERRLAERSRSMYGPGNNKLMSRE